MGPDELKVAYASSDIFLFPSAVETFGNVTLEAAGSGLPLIAEGGCSGHLVKSGVNGYACTAGDEDAFYEATLDLILNPKKRKRFAERSREHSLLFEQHAVMREMVEIYSEITEDFRTKYQGRHSNRDAIFENNDSFRAGGNGTVPGVFLIEWFFVTVFRVTETMLWVTAFVNSRLLPRPIEIHHEDEKIEMGPILRGRNITVPSSSALLRDDFSDTDEFSGDATSVAFGDSETCIKYGEMTVYVGLFCLRSTTSLKAIFSKCCSLPQFVRNRSNKKCDDCVSMAIEQPEPNYEGRRKFRRSVQVV